MNKDDSSQFNRRDFLNSSASGLAMAMAGGAVLELTPQALGQAEDAPKNDNTPPVTVGVIGCGVWGRELLKTLATIPNAPVVAVSDTYPAYLRRGLRGAPKAKGYPSHTELACGRKRAGRRRRHADASAPGSRACRARGR